MSDDLYTLGRFGKRLLLPATLLTLGVGMLIGCIPMPLPEKVLSGRDFRGVLHPKRAEPRIRIGTPRGEVEAILGKPGYRADEGQTVGYLLEVRKGFYLIPLCFTATPRNRWYLLRVR